LSKDNLGAGSWFNENFPSAQVVLLAMATIMPGRSLANLRRTSFVEVVLARKLASALRKITLSLAALRTTIRSVYAGRENT